MPILRRLLFQAAQRVAADPRVRAKAAEVVQSQVLPRAEQAWRDTKPKLAAAKAELQDIAREVDPRDDPRAFATKVKNRFLHPERRR